MKKKLEALMNKTGILIRDLFSDLKHVLTSGSFLNLPGFRKKSLQ
jgi:hypothetical protein